MFSNIVHCLLQIAVVFVFGLNLPYKIHFQASFIHSFLLPEGLETTNFLHNFKEFGFLLIKLFILKKIHTKTEIYEFLQMLVEIIYQFVPPIRYT